MVNLKPTKGPATTGNEAPADAGNGAASETLRIEDVTDVSQLALVPHIKSIPLYENLEEEGVQKETDKRFSLTGEGVKPLPVGLDFQLLSVNGGMYLVYFKMLNKTKYNKFSVVHKNTIYH